MKVLMQVVAVLLALLAPAFAEERRVDLFTPEGKRTGYAIMDRGTGRVDFYDVKSRRIGWGRVDSTGTVERFGLDGRRQADTALPLPPRPPKK